MLPLPAPSLGQPKKARSFVPTDITIMSAKAREASSMPVTFEQPPPSYTEAVYNAPRRISPPAAEPARIPTRTTSSSRLQKPIAIPATMPTLGSPFLRAYPPALEAYDLPQKDFLDILDKLNRIAVKNPPLQVLGLAAGIVGFVPLQTAQIVSASVRAATTLTTVALSKGRSEMFLREVNKEVFQPRGLKMEIAKIDALAKVAEMPILNAEGKLDKNASLLEPIEDLETSHNLTSQKRRLQALEPWVAHLELTPLPEIDAPSNPLSKLSIKASEMERGKEEKKLLKTRREAHEEYGKESRKVQKEYEKEKRKLDEEREKALRKGKNSDLEKIEKETKKVEKEYEKEMRKCEKERRKDDKEESGMRKILWVIIRNIDADSGDGPNPDVSDEERSTV